MTAKRVVTPTFRIASTLAPAIASRFTERWAAISSLLYDAARSRSTCSSSGSSGSCADASSAWSAHGSRARSVAANGRVDVRDSTASHAVDRANQLRRGALLQHVAGRPRLHHLPHERSVVMPRQRDVPLLPDNTPGASASVRRRPYPASTHRRWRSQARALARAGAPPAVHGLGDNLHPGLIVDQTR